MFCEKPKGGSSEMRRVDGLTQVIPLREKYVERDTPGAGLGVQAVR
jgi:hypothetical protein